MAGVEKVEKKLTPDEEYELMEQLFDDVRWSGAANPDGTNPDVDPDDSDEWDERC